MCPAPGQRQWMELYDRRLGKGKVNGDFLMDDRPGIILPGSPAGRDYETSPSPNPVNYWRGIPPGFEIVFFFVTAI